MKFIKTVTRKIEVSFIDARNDIIWITGEGKIISLTNMVDRHILNTIHMLRIVCNNYKNGEYYPCEWIEIFKMEIEFRDSTRKLLSLSSIKNKF